MRREHVITIKSDPTAKPSGQQDVVRPSKRGKSLARRLQGRIRLYDMGYWNNGGWETIPYYDPLRDDNITTILPSPPASVHESIFPIATAAQFEGRDDIIFGVPMEDWTTTFKLVDSAYAAVTRPFISWNGTTYNLADDPPEWNDGVLTPPGSFSSGFAAGLGEGPLDLGGLLDYVWGYNPYDTSYKVTTERDYSADAVAFTPGRKMDVFIFPSFNEAIAFWTLFSTFDEFFAVFRILRSREWAFDPGYEYYQIDLATQWSGHGLPIYEDVFAVINYVKEYYPSVRAGYTPVGPAPPATWTLTDPVTFPNSASFPPPPSLPPSGLINASIIAPIQDITAGISLDITVPGVLRSVIRKGGRYYYFWQT